MPPVTAVLLVTAVIGLPLAGALLGGRQLHEFLAFPPPLRIPKDYLRFSWAAALAVAGVLMAVLLPWVGRRRAVAADGVTDESPPHVAGRRLPRWGWVALAWTLGWWVLAWTRWEWFQPLQRYTFFPLWMGFIVSVNALTERRKGSCLMRRAPARWCGLFGISALCWWSFEWLNRFVENWHYLNVQDFGALAYTVHASLCFSTVLPAVAGVAEWISSHRTRTTYVTHGPAWTWLQRRDVAAVLLVFGVLSLVLTGVRPTWFYPALWVSPLALAFASEVLHGRRGVVHELATGNWQRVATWMAAALICGFFWELWNWHSAAKWIYTVPGVERWHLFEMPALGYAGYLPFGVECMVVAQWLRISPGARG